MAAAATHQFAECITCHAWNADHSLVAFCPNYNEVHIYKFFTDKWEKLHVLSKEAISWTMLFSRGSMWCTDDNKEAVAWTVPVSMKSSNRMRLLPWPPPCKDNGIGLPRGDQHNQFIHENDKGGVKDLMGHFIKDDLMVEVLELLRYRAVMVAYYRGPGIAKDDLMVKVLKDNMVSKDILKLRAKVLKKLGTIFQGVSPDVRTAYALKSTRRRRQQHRAEG